MQFKNNNNKTGAQSVKVQNYVFFFYNWPSRKFDPTTYK